MGVQAREGAIVCEIDAGDLAGLRKALDPAVFRGIVVPALTDLLHIGQAFVMEHIPKPPAPPGASWKRTGNLRRATQVDTAHLNDPEHPRGSVFNAQPYAWWIETGETKSGRQMQIMPGGYRMFEGAEAETAKQAEAVMNRVADEYAKAWASL